MKKKKIQKIYIFLLVSFLFGLLPIYVWAETENDSDTILLTLQDCTVETTDILLHIRDLATKLLQEPKKTRQYVIINQIYIAFVSDYELLVNCHEYKLYQKVLTMIKNIDLNNIVNVKSAIDLIDEALIKIFENYPESEKQSLNYSSINNISQKMANNSIEKKINKDSLEDTIDGLSGIIKSMLNLTVRLTNNDHLKNERDFIVQELNRSMDKCIKKGKLSHNPVIEKLLMQLTTIKHNYQNQIIETIHFLDHTLRVLTYLGNKKSLT